MADFSVNKSVVISSRLKVHILGDGASGRTFADDVLSGLGTSPKFLNPKYFYDKAGSELFEKICTTNEYYVTRTEDEILVSHSADIADSNKSRKCIVELGSGSSAKSRHILKAFLVNGKDLKYIPVDVSEIMIRSSEELTKEFEDLQVEGVLAEYEKGLEKACETVSSEKLIMFLGSSIGNFSMKQSKDLIKHIGELMQSGDALLIGFDLVKSDRILNAAYNDAAGITADFNLNLLKRINSELGGGFDLDEFRHKAFFNAVKSRIEMHLRSLRTQEVYIKSLDKTFYFEKNETIHTENSYKFTDGMIEDLALSAGLKFVKEWKDPKNYFALCLFEKK